MDVSALLEPRIDLERLTEVLDGLGHEGRVHTVRGWTKKHQAALFEAAKGYRPIDLEFLVPASVGPLVEVIHEGKNSLPVHTRFQKRFVRLEGEGGRVAGYNHQAMSAFSGPGYFMVAKGEGEHLGELCVDYRSLPLTPKDKPASWPAIRPNQGGIPGLTYGGLIDYVRALSAHVSIARAYKGTAMNAWFALVRTDVA